MTRHADTVADAIAHPEREQPYAELGLKPDEYQRIRDILGRRPTSAELAMYSVMWSEHCSYKSSKVHLRQFGDKKPETDALLVGIGENAGVVDIGDGWAVTFKVESHNHPSYVEGQEIVVPLKNGEGGYVADEATLDLLEGEGRVVARYLEVNPNGSRRDIAGISNERGNVVGLMPHPEHAVEELTGPSTDGLGFFTSVLKAAVSA